MSFEPLRNAPQAAGGYDLSNKQAGVQDPAIAALGDMSMADGTTEGFVAQSKAEIMRRHKQLEARRDAQRNEAMSLATGNATTSASASAKNHERWVDVPRDQRVGVITVCNRQRAPITTEPCFILEHACATMEEARAYAQRAVATPGYVGAPMAIPMREFEMLAVSEQRQVDGTARPRKIERLLGRHYLDLDVRKREMSQNVMLRKAGRIGLSREYESMKNKAKQDKLRNKALRRQMKKAALERKRMTEAALKELEKKAQHGNNWAFELLLDDDKTVSDAADVNTLKIITGLSDDEQKQAAVTSKEENETEDQIAKAPISKVLAPTTEATENDANDDDGPTLEELDAQAEEIERATLHRLGGRKEVKHEFPASLVAPRQSWAVIGVVNDTDTENDVEDGVQKDVVGNEPLIIWYGAFPDEGSARACITSALAENADVGQLDCVPMYVPLFPNSIDLNNVEEHYKDAEQEKVVAFKKSQRHAQAKFDELCEGMDLPIMDLTTIDISADETEARWRKACADAKESGAAAPPLPRQVVERYAAAFAKNEGVIPDDVRRHILDKNVQGPISSGAV